MDNVWMQVTKDEFELPIAVAQTAKELADITGKTEDNIRSSVCKAEKAGRRCSYVRVDLEKEC